MAEEDIDVSALPTYSFGPESVNWWGTVGLMVIEGLVTFLCIATYFYLRTNNADWPPPPTPLPKLGWPTVNTVLLFLILIATIATDRAARRDEIGRMKAGMVLMSLIGLILCVTRYYEFSSLQTKWDANVYGSVTWTLLGIHYSHILSEVVETLAITSLVLLGHIEGIYRSNVSDSCLLWYFIVGIWVIIYPVLYLTPRFL